MLRLAVSLPHQCCPLSPPRLPPRLQGDESVKDRFPLREEQVLMYLDGDLPEEAIQQEMRLAVSQQRGPPPLCMLWHAALCCAVLCGLESSRRCGWRRGRLLHIMCIAAHAAAVLCTSRCSVVLSIAHPPSHHNPAIVPCLQFCPHPAP
jgi:hypothetical protein